MFVGEYEHQLDGKNRIRIPAAFKNELGKDYVFHEGADNIIEVFPKKTMDEQLDKYKVDISDYNKLKALMLLTASFTEAHEDNQGRVVLSDKLKSFAQIDKDVVTIGLIDRLIILSKANRDKLKEQMSYKDAMDCLSGK